MKSFKTVKRLEDIVLPFLFTPQHSDTIYVSGKPLTFEINKPIELEFPQFEAILNSRYGTELTD